MVGSEAQVTVTGENQHQAALARYRPGATVAVELGWCTIRSGKYRGERAIEVRLDGQRVGELTHLMTQRYGSLVSRVAAGGGRPGAEATIHSGARGLEITLRMPKDPDALPVTPADEPTVVLGAVRPPVPAAPGRKVGRPLWIGAAVFVLVVFFAALGGGEDEEAPSSGVAADSTTTAPVTTTTTTPPPTTTTTTPKPKPKPRTTDQPAPPPEPKPKPEPEPAPEPEPEPEPACDPNYSGCVPIASDVDCAGGSGNGPAYANGPVQVVGEDVYGLDRDGDGTACDG
ncbi:hypothetical protein [Actinophytocola gossypii]|uniref:Excalibur calcium-binding domain-containing protein n=1 Tax=Actinophytocola gossypii TaxID=2812003 RepID=A0ABT2JIY8_9PSEU|nr:hypothetical protein [Actinophytocola gossypii]MCT2587852.1 hypothetical protein [Actinophytocola gossypii]